MIFNTDNHVFLVWCENFKLMTFLIIRKKRKRWILKIRKEGNVSNFSCLFLVFDFTGGSCSGVSVSLQSMTNPNLPKAEAQVFDCSIAFELNVFQISFWSWNYIIILLLLLSRLLMLLSPLKMFFLGNTKVINILIILNCKIINWIYIHV